MPYRPPDDRVLLYASIVVVAWVCFLLGILVLGAVLGALDAAVAAVLVPSLTTIVIAGLAIRKVVKDA